MIWRLHMIKFIVHFKYQKQADQPEVFTAPYHIAVLKVHKTLFWKAMSTVAVYLDML
jgi:hypothetical protein